MQTVKIDLDAGIAHKLEAFAKLLGSKEILLNEFFEYHKERMASVIWHSFNQITKQGFVKLFKSHKDGFLDGQQLRDFVYVKDVVQVIHWLMQHSIQVENGLYNLGTGKARSFECLANATFSGLNKEANIEYIDMPLDIRDKYQYFTEARMQKWLAAGMSAPKWNLELAIEDYVKNYLLPGEVLF